MVIPKQKNILATDEHEFSQIINFILKFIPFFPYLCKSVTILATGHPLFLSFRT